MQSSPCYRLLSIPCCLLLVVGLIWLLVYCVSGVPVLMWTVRHLISQCMLIQTQQLDVSSLTHVGWTMIQNCYSLISTSSSEARRTRAPAVNLTLCYSIYGHSILHYMICISMCVYIYINIYVYMYLYLYVCIYIYIYIYIYVHVRVCVYIYIHTYTHLHIHTHPFRGGPEGPGPHPEHPGRQSRP